MFPSGRDESSGGARGFASLLGYTYKWLTIAKKEGHFFFSHTVATVKLPTLKRPLSVTMPILGLTGKPDR